LRSIIINNIDAWSKKTWSFAFWGGTNIKHPEDNNISLKVPNGIANMIPILNKHNFIKERDLSLDEANQILNELSIIGLKRFALGTNAKGRSSETSDLYEILASINTYYPASLNTNEKAWEVAAKNLAANPNGAAHDPNRITDELLQKANSLQGKLS